MKENEIQEIYDKHIKINNTEEYIKRYDPLPLNLNNTAWRWEGKDFPRVPAVLEFKRYMEKYNFNFEKVLSFNGSSDPEYHYLKYKTMKNYNYADDKEKYDLHNLDLDENDFDFVMLNQTLEHLYDPISVLKSLYNHFKKGWNIILMFLQIVYLIVHHIIITQE